MDAYKLYTDRPTTFECNIQLEGASLKNAKARLIAEAADKTLLFTGRINSSGKCKIDVSKLRGLFEEDTRGNLKLEVIVDDTYFEPWESPFFVTAAKKLRVEVASQPVTQTKKMVVDVQTPRDARLDELTTEIVKSLKKKRITSENVLNPKTKRYVTRFIKEAVKRTDEKVDTHLLITKVVNKLAE